MVGRRRRTHQRHSLRLDVLPQPDDTTCGPTCLHAIYRYYGDKIELPAVVNEVTALPGGGTLAVSLACHALRRGYDATIFTYNLLLFDPTWFGTHDSDIPRCLVEQLRARPDRKLGLATRAYLDFFELGGSLRYEELTADLVRRPLKRGVPILTGLSATYLYGCARERDDEYDSIAGTPAGHFVVISGYDTKTRQVLIADPLHDNPRYRSPLYRVGLCRLIGAVLLSIVTYDANLLVITPRSHRSV